MLQSVHDELASASAGLPAGKAIALTMKAVFVLADLMGLIPDPQASREFVEALEGDGEFNTMCERMMIDAQRAAATDRPLDLARFASEPDALQRGGRATPELDEAMRRLLLKPSASRPILPSRSLTTTEMDADPTKIEYVLKKSGWIRDEQPIAIFVVWFTLCAWLKMAYNREVARHGDRTLAVKNVIRNNAADFAACVLCFVIYGMMCSQVYTEPPPEPPTPAEEANMSIVARSVGSVARVGKILAEPFLMAYYKAFGSDPEFIFRRPSVGRMLKMLYDTKHRWVGATNLSLRRFGLKAYYDKYSVRDSWWTNQGYDFFFDIIESKPVKNFRTELARTVQALVKKVANQDISAEIITREVAPFNDLYDFFVKVQTNERLYKNMEDFANVLCVTLLALLAGRSFVLGKRHLIDNPASRVAGAETEQSALLDSILDKVANAKPSDQSVNDAWGVGDQGQIETTYLRLTELGTAERGRFADYPQLIQWAKDLLRVRKATWRLSPALGYLGSQLDEFRRIRDAVLAERNLWNAAHPQGNQILAPYDAGATNVVDEVFARCADR